MNILIQIYRLAKENFQFSFFVIILAIFGTVYVVKNKNKVIAFAIKFKSYLGYLAVEKKFQGQGHAKRLLAKVKPHIKYLHVKKNCLRTIKIYQKNGFSIKKETILPVGKRYLMSQE